MSCRLVVIGASFVHVKTISSGTYESEDSMGRTSPTKQGYCTVVLKISLSLRFFFHISGEPTFFGSLHLNSFLSFLYQNWFSRFQLHPLDHNRRPVRPTGGRDRKTKEVFQQEEEGGVGAKVLFRPLKLNVPSRRLIQSVDITHLFHEPSVHQ